MLLDIFILFFSGVVLLFPLLIWLFIFVHFRIPRKYFFVGVTLGAIISIVLGEYSIVLKPLFGELSAIGNSTFGEYLFIALAIFFSIPLILTLCFTLFRGEYMKTCMMFFLTLLFLSIGAYYSFQVFPGTAPELLHFSSYVFYTVGGIVGYYIVIALLEEGLKFLGALNIYSMSGSEYFRTCILFGVLVSLGFALSENIIYAYFTYSEHPAALDILHLSFFRSVFALSLHVSAGILFMYAMSFIVFRRKTTVLYSQILPLVLMIVAVGVHALYDIGLTFGNSYVLLVSMALMYLLVSCLIFRREREL